MAVGTPRPVISTHPRVLETAGLAKPGRLTRVREWWEQEHVFGYGLIVPALVLIAGLVAYPFGMAIYFSLSDYWVGSPGEFIGLQNFADVLRWDVFQRTVYNSFVFTAIAVFFKVVLGVWLAMLLFRNFKFKRLIRGAVLLPWVIPTALSTLAWWWMFDSLYSVVNWTAIRLGLMTAPGPNWLGMTEWAMTAVIAVNVWRGLPFFAIIVLAGLVSIPREYYEAAEVDGATSWSRFRHVTLPLLKPVLAVVILFSTIFTFADFNIVQVLTRGGPVNTTHLFATLAYQQGLVGGNLGQGAAISLFLFPLLAAVVFLQLRYIRKE
jgi:multiple sugar transport system permease protein